MSERAVDTHGAGGDEKEEGGLEDVAAVDGLAVESQTKVREGHKGRVLSLAKILIAANQL